MDPSIDQQFLGHCESLTGVFDGVWPELSGRGLRELRGRSALDETDRVSQTLKVSGKRPPTVCLGSRGVAAESPEI